MVSKLERKTETWCRKIGNWKEEGGESIGVKVTHGKMEFEVCSSHFIFKACAFMVLIPSSKAAARNQPKSTPLCRHHPEPSLLGLWLEFLPCRPEHPGHVAPSAAFSPVTLVLLAEPKASAHSNSLLLQHSEPAWYPGAATSQDVPLQVTGGGLSPAPLPVLWGLTSSNPLWHSETLRQDAQCLGQNIHPLFYFTIYTVVFVDL